MGSSHSLSRDTVPLSENPLNITPISPPGTQANEANLQYMSLATVSQHRAFSDNYVLEISFSGFTVYSCAHIKTTVIVQDGMMFTRLETLHPV
jgi:hypothetical protein